ncbi:MAG: hypothetical protein ACFFFG_10415 [Candidatus Thorarchaeota archaeon]
MSSSANELFCSFCGVQIQKGKGYKCQDCQAIFCALCGVKRGDQGFLITCKCGSGIVNREESNLDLKTELLEHLFVLKKALKQVAYRPVVLLKRLGHLESQLRPLMTKFLIPIEQIDRMFSDTKEIEEFILEEFKEFSTKLHRYYQNISEVKGLASSSSDLALQLTLFQKQVQTFDQTVQMRLGSIEDLLDDLSSEYTAIHKMERELRQFSDVFGFGPGELGIGLFPKVELNGESVRKTRVNMLITTNRIMFLQNKRKNVLGNEIVLYDEFGTGDLVDVKIVEEGLLKRRKLMIQAMKREYGLYSDSGTLDQIVKSLQIGYYGEPNNNYTHKPLRDWSSEVYQEEILSALNFSMNTKEDHTVLDSASPLFPERTPNYVSEVVDEHLRDLRIQKMATIKALEELKTGGRKVTNRDYFDLVKQFELDLAKINERITDLLIRSGKTNLFDHF